MAKKLGAVDQMQNGDVKVDSLEHLSNSEAAQKIAEHFAEISNEYAPVDVGQLPSYLPAQPPPQVEEHVVYEKIKSQKKTKSTLPIDIPYKLRRACAAELAAPLTKLWKHEWVTPAPKVANTKVIN